MASTKEIIAPGIRCDVTVIKVIEQGIEKAKNEIEILKDDVNYFKSVNDIERIVATKKEIEKFEALIEKWEAYKKKSEIVIKYFKKEYSINEADVDKLKLNIPYTKKELETLYNNDMKQAETDTWDPVDKDKLNMRISLLDTIKPQLINYMKKHGIELSYSVQDKILRNELDKNYPMSNFKGFEDVKMPEGLVFSY